MVDKTSEYPAVPPDDLKRNLTIAQIDKDQEPAAHWSGRRHIHHHRHRRCHRRTILGDRHAHPARRRPSSTPA